MKNRIPDYLPVPKPNGQPSPGVFQGMHNLAPQQIVDRMRQVESYFQEHPLTVLGAAFCLGICLGWVIKRR